MRCPRCDSDVEKYTLESAARTAIICGSCGFADISAAHYRQESAPESWELALARLNQRVDGRNMAQSTDRTPSVSLPESSEPAQPGTEISLEKAGVQVAASLSKSSERDQRDTANEDSKNSDQ